MHVCVNCILIIHQLADLKNEKDFFFFSMLAIISLKLAVFAREHQSLSVEKAQTYKQQKDNPTQRQINASKLRVFERKTKAERTEGQTPHQTRLAHDRSSHLH